MTKKKGKFFKSARLLLVSLIVISTIILFLSYWYYHVEKEAFINQKVDQLKSIAEIKIDQIVDWRNERNSDARYLSASLQVNESFHRLMEDPDNKAYRLELFSNLNAMFLNGKYESMIAYDESGKSFFSLPEDYAGETDSLNRLFALPASCSIKIGDFYLDNGNRSVMKIVVPQAKVSENDTVPSGFILLSINLENTLFPLLESIPIPSETMKVILLSKGDNGLTQLNLRNIPQASAQLFNVPENTIPELISYNSIKYDYGQVLAVSYPVPGSTSFVVVTIEKDEACKDIRKLNLNMFSVAAFFILAFASSASFLWMKQRNEFMILETEKKMIMERSDMLSKFSNDAIIVYTKDLTILQVNDKALELYDYTRDEFLGMSAELLRSPELRPGLQLMLENTIREGGFRYETIHIRKDGTKFPAEVSLRYMELLGSPCFQALVRDISQRKQFEKALIASEDRLRQITNTVPLIVWTAGPDGTFEFVNSRFEVLTGIYPFKDSVTLDFIHPDDRKRVLMYWKRAINDVREHQIRFRLRMKDGSFRWFLCLAIPMCKETGEVIRWYGSATDVDELENMVAQRTLELSDLYNNAPCGYHSLDMNGMFLKINNTALKWLGYERDEVVGKLAFSDLITDEGKKVFKKNFAILKEKGFVDNLEYEMVRKDGTILPVLLSATAVRDEKGNIVMTRSTIIDHTVRRRHENEILKLNAILQEHSYNLEYANKELEAFTFSVSHDLRAPLRAINGFSQILLDEYGEKLASDGRQLLEKVLSNAVRMRQLIDDLLRLSRTGRQELRYTQIDMHALFNSMIEEVRQMFPDRKIQVSISPMPNASGDLSLLKQVLSNLLSNAVKFSSKKSSSEIRIGSESNTGEVVFYVRDNGTGFDMKFAGELFGVFRRLSNADEYEGTGVGLALVKRIIDKHGGKVWAESEPGKGATFYFSLPVSKMS